MSTQFEGGAPDEERARELELLLREIEQAHTLAEGELRLLARKLECPPLSKELPSDIADLFESVDHISRITLMDATLLIRAVRYIFPDAKPQSFGFNNDDSFVEIEWNDHLTWHVKFVRTAWPTVLVRAYLRKDPNMIPADARTFRLAKSLLDFSEYALKQTF